MKFGEAAEVQQCRCGGGGRCPRQYLALAGFALAGFWVLHLAVNLLGLWPAAFQAVVSRGHALGLALPVLEAGLIFIPLAVHVGLGLRTLAREKLTYGVPKHHQGSALRQWLQRVSAVVLLGFLGFHLLTMQRGLGGRFDAHHAFSSASGAIWQFWRELPAGHPGNVLVAQLYLIGLVAAAYHVGNGIATGAGVLGLTRTPAAERRLWVICRVAAPVLLLAGVVAWGAFAVR
jgi:succinate dehydrogenase/fumarate reductase cytochrome b subunit